GDPHLYDPALLVDAELQINDPFDAEALRLGRINLLVARTADLFGVLGYVDVRYGREAARPVPGCDRLRFLRFGLRLRHQRLADRHRDRRFTDGRIDRDAERRWRLVGFG